MRATTSRCSGKSRAIGFTAGTRRVNVSTPPIFIAPPPRAVDEQRSKLYHAPATRRLSTPLGQTPQSGRAVAEAGHSPRRSLKRVQMRGGAPRPPFELSGG